MCRRLLCLISPVLALGLSTGAAYADAFLQDVGADGIVSMEAENFDENTPQGGHTFELETTVAGYLGIGYMIGLPNSGAGRNPGEGPRLDFKVGFVTSGTHYLWLRAYAGTDPATGNNDSFHAGLDGTADMGADRISGFADAWEWTNDTMDPERTTIEVPSAGLHTLNIWMREDGSLVDKIVLTTNPNYTPSGNGPPESQRGKVLKAYAPDPPDGATGWTSPALMWTAGETAIFHDVYLGTNPDLGPADLVTTPNWQHAMYWHLPGFTAGTTYYWRVDEVELDGTTTHVGDVWSFSTPSLIAQDPDPADVARYVSTDADLSWTAGLGAITHDVYFGTDETEVTNGAGGTFKANQSTTTYDPGTLAKDTKYYWRIDEVEQDNTTKHTGNVWSFTTLPDIPITDPDLAGWWKFEIGSGTMVLDWSGHDNHGTLVPGSAGTVQWVPGLFNLALEFLGDDQGWVELPPDIVTGAQGSILMWVSTDLTNDEAMFWYGAAAGSDGDGYTSDDNEMHINIDDPGQLDFYLGGGSGVTVDGPSIAGAGWVHVAATWDLTDGCKLYLNGEEVGSAAHTGLNVSLGVLRLGRPIGTGNGNRYHDGLMDDVRLFNRAISAAQVKEIMDKGEDPFVASARNPANGSTPDVEHVTPMTWSPGEKAAKHDVYFGTDEDAVIDADSSDTTGVYRGRIDPNSYTPPEALEFGQTYYWRIDEFNTDATISEGRIWSYTVVDYLVIDDCEDYDDFCNRIFYTWEEGGGYNENVDCGILPSGGNGTGSLGGHAQAPYAEQTIVHEGDQSMPMEYLNDGSTGKALYSETQREFQLPQDFTRKGMKSLTLWFRGRPGSVGSFSYDPPTGIYAMTANGADIWYASDEFHYAYKRLSGLGTIEAQVLSVDNTDPWAKAGVMIRETLDPNSPFAAVYIAPGNGCRFQARFVKGENADSDTLVTELAHIRAPHWIKLERLAGGGFNAYDSNDPAVEGWHPLAWNTQTVNMSANVYIGLALTSHNTDPTVVCTAEFSDVAMTGTVTGQWQSQDIGIASNDAEQLYVALEDSTGTAKDVPHPDPNAVLLSTWQEWNIELADFAPVDLTKVKKIYIGVGNRNAPTLGGGGMLYIDDIRLYPPRCMPLLAKPAADFNNNCIVDYPDLDILAADWLLEAITVGEVAEVLFEAEAADTIADPLQIWSDRPDALGGQYVEVAPGNTDTGNPPADGHATYVFNVTGGVYKILARTIAPSGSDDSFWLQIQGATTQTNNHSSGWVRWGVVNSSDWSWTPVRSMDDSDQTVHFTMPAGTYTMEIAYREDGTLLDAFLITDNLDLAERALLPEWVETDLNDDKKIDFKDYALLAGTWLDEELWP